MTMAKITPVESKFSCEGKEDVGDGDTDEMYVTSDESCNGENLNDLESLNSAQTENVVSHTTANACKLRLRWRSGWEYTQCGRWKGRNQLEIRRSMLSVNAAMVRRRTSYNEHIKKESDVNKFKSKELQAFICPITQEIMTDPVLVWMATRTRGGPSKGG